MMTKTAKQLLRSVYRLLDRPPDLTPVSPEVWEDLKGEIETYLVDNWEPVIFITYKSALNEKINNNGNAAAAESDKDKPPF